MVGFGRLGALATNRQLHALIIAYFSLYNYHGSNTVVTNFVTVQNLQVDYYAMTQFVITYW